jgi:DnaA family protein
MQQLPLGLSDPPPPTLDNFAPGPNAHVVGMLRQWLAGALAGPTLYLWGPAGVGKSHLLRAACDWLGSQGRPASYVAAGMALAREPADGLQLLVLDDLGALSVSSQATLFTLLNDAGRSGPRLLLAGDNAPSGLGLRADVSTRVSQGLVLQLRGLSDEDKREALRQHAGARGFDLAEDAAEYLLRHGRRDLPSLMRVLDAADRYSLQVRRTVSVALLREVLQRSEGEG